MFHPEVVHTPDGAKLIRNFVRKVAGLTGDWTMRAFKDEAIVARWTRLIRLRDAVNVEIEKLRQQKVVGTSLAAKVRLEPRGSLAGLLDPAQIAAAGVDATARPETLAPAQFAALARQL